MDLPIDGHKLTFVISEPSTPRRDFSTGEQRTDKASGRGIWDVVLLAGDGSQSMPIKVKMFEDIPGQQMTPVHVEGLALVRLEMRDGAKIEYFTARSITPHSGGQQTGQQTGQQGGGQQGGAGSAGGKPAAPSGGAGQSTQGAAGKAGA